MNDFIQMLGYIVQGVGITLEYTLIAIIGGSVLGILIALLQYYQKANFLTRSYISFIRGTPLLVQLTLVYFVLPSIFKMSLSVFVAGCIAFILNSSAYIAEILRAGINSVDKGQFAAAKALQLSSFAMWKDIILPQAAKNIWPAFINEVITLVKETALISTLGEADIMRRAQLVAAEHYTYIQPLCIAALCYYGLTFVIENVAKKLERKWFYAKYATSV